MRVSSECPQIKGAKRHSRRLQLLALAVCALVPGVTSAANINIMDLTDTLTVAGTQFEGGFSGSVSQETVTLQGSWISNGGVNSTGILYLVEPNTNLVSDILRLTFTCDNPSGCMAGVTGTFQSDVTGNLGTLPAGFTGIPETGALQNVTNLLQNPATGATITIPANLTISVQSDVSETGEVPEPTTIGLTLVGLALLGGKSLRRT
jgi:hypothetical protein